MHFSENLFIPFDSSTVFYRYLKKSYHRRSSRIHNFQIILPVIRDAVIIHVATTNVIMTLDPGPTHPPRLTSWRGNIFPLTYGSQTNQETCKLDIISHYLGIVEVYEMKSPFITIIYHFNFLFQQSKRSNGNRP